MAEGHVSFRDGPKGRSWFYTVPIIRPNGSKGQEQRRGFKSERAARKAKNLRLAALETGAQAVATKQTLAEYLNFWLEQTRRDVGAASLQRYESVLRLVVLPGLGAVRLDRLTALQLDALYTNALEDGASIHKVRAAHQILKGALRRAVDWDLIPKNPCTAARPPRESQGIEPEDRRVRALTDEEAQRLLVTLDGMHWLAAYLALGTGLRRGELLGLRWQDVNFETGMLSVRQTVEPPVGAGNDLVIGPPKTRASIRTFRAPDRVLQQLRKHRSTQSARRLALEVPWEGDHVLCRDGGKPFHPDSVSRWHRKARSRAGLPDDIRFHDWRHTYATNALREGVSITAVSKRLGHASVSITLNIYSHALPEDHELAARAADAVLERVCGAC